MFKFFGKIDHRNNQNIFINCLLAERKGGNVLSASRKAILFDKSFPIQPLGVNSEDSTDLLQLQKRSQQEPSRLWFLGEFCLSLIASSRSVLAVNDILPGIHSFSSFMETNTQKAHFLFTLLCSLSSEFSLEISFWMQLLTFVDGNGRRLWKVAKKWCNVSSRLPDRYCRI